MREEEWDRSTVMSFKNVRFSGGGHDTQDVRGKFMRAVGSALAVTFITPVVLEPMKVSARAVTRAVTKTITTERLSRQQVDIVSE